MSKTITELYEARLDTGLSDDDAQRAVLPKFEELREWAANPPARGWFRRAPAPPQGLYLWGGVGRGKSMLMDLFFEAAATEQKRRVHFHAFMQEVQNALHQARQRGADDAVAPVAAEIADGLRLLCFDEMQITDIADAMIVGRLFEKLFDAGVVVVTTSNRPPEDLYKDGLNRQLFLPFIDLLRARMDVHHLEAEDDYRQGRESGRTYFTPADATARTEIDRIWTELAGGPGAPLRLQVRTREIILPEHRDGVARVPFQDLCGAPLGPGDYLALVERIDTLILEDVPRLSRSNFNQAKRFVTLIDTLYEAGTRLVVSAAEEPEQLYAEGEGAFEFERTASRLREMQSTGWGA